MAGRLSDDTVAAIKKWAPKLNSKVAQRYGVSKQALLGKLVMGESGDSATATSPVGAHGRTQFMPGSRDIAIKKFGVDPWRSADEAVHAAVLHLNGKINGSTGLEGYNPGDPNYPKYILSQKVGDLGGSAPPTVDSVGSTKTVTQSRDRVVTKTDDDAAILDSLIAGNAGRKGNSLGWDIATRLSSGDYTSSSTVTDSSTKTVPTLGASTDSPTKTGGQVTFADTAFREGHKLQDYTSSFLDSMTEWAGSLKVGTATNHDQYTDKGKVSDHWDGSAADIPAAGKRGDDIAYAAFRAAGVTEAKARRWAKAGGLYNVVKDGVRYQIIWKTSEGGNHYDHVHVGVRPGGTAAPPSKSTPRPTATTPAVVPKRSKPKAPTTGKQRLYAHPNRGQPGASQQSRNLTK